MRVASNMDLARIIYEASRATGNQILKDPVLAIDATAEAFKLTNDFAYSIDGVVYTKDSATGLTFTAAHVVTADKFGVIAIEIDNAGTVTSRVNEATQTTAMAYATAALAWAARLTAPSAATKRIVAYIKIAADGTTWTANTDDMTDASDLDTAEFVAFDDETRTDFGSSWEEEAMSYRDTRASEVHSYLMSGTVPATVAAEVNPIIFQAVIEAAR